MLVLYVRKNWGWSRTGRERLMQGQRLRQGKYWKNSEEFHIDRSRDCAACTRSIGLCRLGCGRCLDSITGVDGVISGRMELTLCWSWVPETFSTPSGVQLEPLVDVSWTVRYSNDCLCQMTSNCGPISSPLELRQATPFKPI